MNNAINNIADEKTQAFAAACYDMNSVAELISDDDNSDTDMAAWGINRSQWQEATDAALNDLLHDWVIEYVEGCNSNGVDPREAIAENFNVAVENVEIDDEGDIHVGQWLDVAGLAEFQAWHTATYA